MTAARAIPAAYDPDPPPAGPSIGAAAASARSHRQMTTLVVATAGVSVLNYAYTLAILWLLHPTQYAVVGAASALLLISGTVAGASIPWVLARELALGREPAQRQAVVAFCLAATALQGVVTAIAVVLAAVTYATAAEAVALAASVILIFVAATGVGYLQGQSRFGLIAVLRIAEVVLKIAAGIALVVIGFGATGAITGFAAGAGVVAIVTLLIMRPDVRRVRGASVNAELWSSALGLLGIQAGAAIIASLDIALGGILVHDRTSFARYAAAQIPGRIPVFVGAALSIVVFPRLVAATTRRTETIRHALRLYVGVCVPVAGVVATAPHTLLALVMPAKYGNVAALLPWAALTGLGMGFINLTTTFFQAAQLFRRTIGLLAVAVVATAGVEMSGVLGWGVSGLARAASAAGAVVALTLIIETRRTWPGSTRGLLRTATGAGILAAPLWLLHHDTVGWLVWAGVAGLGAAYALTMFGRADRGPAGRPRVLHLGYEDPRRPGAGGGSLRTYEMNRCLAEEFDITVVCARYRGARRWEEDGVTYVHVGLPLGYFGTMLAYFACLPLALARYSSDLVVEDFGAPFSTVAVPWLTARPVIGVVQWLFAAEKAKQYHLPLDRVEEVGLASHRSLIAVSAELGANLSRRNPSAQVSIIPNGLDDLAWAPRQVERSGIRYLGRLEKAQKGLDLLLDAYSRIAGDVGQDLVIGGAGPDRAELERLAASLGIGHRVRFVGNVATSERFTWLASAEVLVMPSRYESFGLVAAEALAVKTPVIAFDIPCLRELVDDRVGVAVPPFDVEALAQAIASLVRDPARRARLGEAGPARVGHLDWRELAQAQAVVYRTALACDADREQARRPVSMQTAPRR